MYNIKIWKQDFLQSFYSFSLKKNFCENCLIIILSTYCALSWQKFSKSPHIRSWDIRLNNIGLSWTLITKFPSKNFLENLNVTFIYQLYPIIIPIISEISIEWIMRYKVTLIWDNLIQITHLPHREIVPICPIINTSKRSLA